MEKIFEKYCEKIWWNEKVYIHLQCTNQPIHYNGGWCGKI